MSSGRAAVGGDATRRGRRAAPCRRPVPLGIYDVAVSNHGDRVGYRGGTDSVDRLRQRGGPVAGTRGRASAGTGDARRPGRRVAPLDPTAADRKRRPGRCWRRGRRAAGVGDARYHHGQHSHVHSGRLTGRHQPAGSDRNPGLAPAHGPPVRTRARVASLTREPGVGVCPGRTPVGVVVALASRRSGAHRNGSGPGDCARRRRGIDGADVRQALRGRPRVRSRRPVHDGGPTAEPR